MFEIGDEVLCIKTHSWGFVIEGRSYVVKDMKLSSCCKTLLLDVGAYNSTNGMTCHKCNMDHHYRDNVAWLNCKLFVKLSEFKKEEVAQLMQSQPQKIEV